MKKLTKTVFSAALALTFVLSSGLMVHAVDLPAAEVPVGTCLLEEEVASAVKEQVIYTIKYIDKDSMDEIISKVKKIDFSGNEVTEKAENIEGYDLVSPAEQQMTLDVNGENVLVFEYEKKAEGNSTLELEQADALNTIHKKLGWLSENDKKYYAEEIGKARTAADIQKSVDEAIKENEKKVPIVKYTVNYVNAETGEMLDSYRKLDFAGALIEEKAPQFPGLGLISAETQSIYLKNTDENVITFQYKTYDDPDMPLQEFLQQKINYDLPLVYENTDFTGRPEALKDYLTRKMHHGDYYAVFTCTKEEQEEAYRDVFDKSSRSGNLRFVRNWTSAEDVADRTVPHTFKVAFTYDDSRENMQATEDKIYQFIQNNVTAEMSDYEKVKLFHDYIVQNTEPAVNKNLTSIYRLENGQPTNSSAAVMLQNKGICEGYAMTFCRMAEMAGMESIYVGGLYVPAPYFTAYGWNFEKEDSKYREQMAKDRFKMNHGWNMVKVDGNWYHVDVYHDDFFEMTSPGMRQGYSCFLRSDVYMHEKTCRFWDAKYVNAVAEKDYKSYQGSYYPLLQEFI